MELYEIQFKISYHVTNSTYAYIFYLFTVLRKNKKKIPIYIIHTWQSSKFLRPENISFLDVFGKSTEKTHAAIVIDVIFLRLVIFLPLFN